MELSMLSLIWTLQTQLQLHIMALLTLEPCYAGEQCSCLQVELSIIPTRLKLTSSFLQSTLSWMVESLNHVNPQKLILRAWQDTWITLHLNKELNHMESCLLWNTAQTCRLSFGLTQAVGDQEPKHPGLSRLPLSSVTADNGAVLIRTQQQRALLKHAGVRVWTLARKGCNAMSSSVGLFTGSKD